MGKNLDKYDRAILRILIDYKDNYLSTNEIAKKIEASTLTAKRHLGKLEGFGYVSKKNHGKVREYEKSKKIKAPSRILWTLRYKK